MNDETFDGYETKPIEELSPAEVNERALIRRRNAENPRWQRNLGERIQEVRQGFVSEDFHEEMTDRALMAWKARHIEKGDQRLDPGTIAEAPEEFDAGTLRELLARSAEQPRFRAHDADCWG